MTVHQSRQRQVQLQMIRIATGIYDLYQRLPNYALVTHFYSQLQLMYLACHKKQLLKNFSTFFQELQRGLKYNFPHQLPVQLFANLESLISLSTEFTKLRCLQSLVSLAAETLSKIVLTIQDSTNTISVSTFQQRKMLKMSSISLHVLLSNSF